MKFPLYIAKRYLFTKSKSNAINIITIIAAIGVFAGAFSLFIVLSGFSGLRDFSLSFSNEFDPDLKALPREGKVIQISDEQLKELEQLEGVAYFSKIIEERVILSNKLEASQPFFEFKAPIHFDWNKLLGDKDRQFERICELLLQKESNITSIIPIGKTRPNKMPEKNKNLF